ncbi:MAG: hypothetical protein UGF89_01125 [Acutalibacteraceae bacterium]|nr:hypothetical protein [Acutalibacteraceae bacterium]
MKKFMKKLKGKKVLSFVLAAIMLATTFNIALPMLKLDASAATTIDGVSQTQIVTDTSVYNTYASNYLGGASYSTGIIIPGLDPAQDYVIQGMTYYPKRDWMLVTAYHNYDSENDAAQSSSKVFALDAATGEFVAMFSFLNPDGSVNYDHGGGIAVSENNIYYSCGDKDRKIAYAPLSALENAPLNAHTQIQLVAEKDFVEIGSVSKDSKTAYSAYVCYDEGVLWMGNFYDLGAKLLGVTIAAADYNAPSNNSYNSMVFGYKLTGSTPAEEWANLTGAKGKDCQGSPSYAIALSNNLKDVQYATVDNGKLYLSRSYGSGAGNSISFGFGESSYLTVADIDLSVPGTTPVTISTTGTGSLDKTINAYEINDYSDFAMMPMSEGLCVIDGDIFITFEGASNKYLNESSGVTSIGNCDKPVDVIWQLDPYDLMNIEEAEIEKSIRYEQVNHIDELESGEEYIIVYESAEKDLVTQEKILYAFDAFGNFKDYKLSKSTASTVNGYNGMIGHAITDYDITEDGILYLNDPEKDDVENIRWTLNNVSGENYKITNTSTYFANCNCFYFDEDQITMAPSNAGFLSKLGITQLNPGDGRFYFKNGNYWLWCNDGTKADYNTKINSYYSNNATYNGLTEQKGTIHCDALNTYGNVMGQSIPDDGGIYSEGAFRIFRRIVDSSSSVYESRVYTGLDAELQADGTYTVTLETYATSPNHYVYRDVKPTDYIIVADTSSSMGNKDGSGVVGYTGNLGVASLSLEANTSDDNGTGVSGYAFSNPEEDIYIKHSDGNYYKVYMAVNTTELKKTIGIITKMRQKYYVYYIADDGLYYCVQDHAVNPVGRTYSEWKAWVDSGEHESDYSTKTNNGNRRKEDVYQGPHYRYDNVSHHPEDQEFQRISTLKEATKDLIVDIAAENSQNRIALLQYGADTSSGFYNTSGSRAQSGYTNALWSLNDSNVSTLKGIVDAFSTSQQTSNNGIEFNHVNEIIANSGAIYKGANSDRNVAVIFISDGVAGSESSSDFTTAANNVIAKALIAKQAGAFVYTAVIGADGVSSDRGKYLEAVSSKYAGAKSMSDIGGQSVDGINYTLSLATATINNFLNFGGFALKETAENNGVGLESLDANAYLREQLSDAFMFPKASEYNVKVELVPGVYDKIGRFDFDEASATTNHLVTHTLDTEARTVTVTNYNYAEQYIGKNKSTPGNKLRVTISGLLANPDADLTNTSINNTKTTGLFKTKGNMDSNVAFKYLPTEYFNIPKYTYVLDYGLQMLDTDVNGTLKAVSAGLTKQDTSNYNKISENKLVAIQSGDQNLLYSANPELAKDSGYVLIQRDDGTYDWFEIEVVPASNVYFEETEFDKTAGTGTVAWGEATGGSSVSHRELPDELDVDGYDKAYNNTNTYSNGKTLSASVDATNKRSKTATVEFVGDGIDIISACGSTTGMQIINVKDAKTGKSVKAAIVDTFYDGETFTQVPVFNWRGDYGTYIVESTAVYLSNAGALKKSGIKSFLVDTGLIANTSDDFNTPSVQDMLDAAGFEDIKAEDLELVWFDDNSVLNGGSGVAPTKKGTRGTTTSSVTLNNYLDGFRVYNPLGSDSPLYDESEQGAVYYNVIDSLIDGKLSDGDLDFASGSIAFVTGSLADGETLSFSNYESIGPENELYLQGGASEGVAFNAPIADGGRVMISLRAVNGETKVKVNDKEFTVKSATEMYYDITDALDPKDGQATVSIINTGDKILSVNNIKITKGNSGASLMTLDEGDIEAVQYYAAMEPVQATVNNGVVTPVVDEEEINPGDTTNPDNNDTNDDTNTDNGEKEEFNIFSLIELLISLIENILHSAFGTGSLF